MHKQTYAGQVPSPDLSFPICKVGMTFFPSHCFTYLTKIYIHTFSVLATILSTL